MVNKRIGLVTAAAACAGALVGVLLVSGAPASAYEAVVGNSDGGNVQIDATTADGKTLGRVPAAAGGTISAQEMPDYIYTYGDSGRGGYVLRADVERHEAEPTSPSQALELQANRKDFVVNVYAID